MARCHECLAIRCIGCESTNVKGNIHVRSRAADTYSCEGKHEIQGYYSGQQASDDRISWQPPANSGRYRTCLALVAQQLVYCSRTNGCSKCSVLRACLTTSIQRRKQDFEIHRSQVKKRQDSGFFRKSQTMRVLNQKRLNDLIGCHHSVPEHMSSGQASGLPQDDHGTASTSPSTSLPSAGNDKRES